MFVPSDKGKDWSVSPTGGDLVRDPDGFVMLMPAPSGWILGAHTFGSFVLAAPGMPVDTVQEARRWRSPSWDAAGRTIVFWADGKIQRYDLETQRTEDLMSVPDLGFLAPSPDGKTIYYTEGSAHSKRAIIANYGDLPRPWAARR
jgi:hypothetical protein